MADPWDPYSRQLAAVAAILVIPLCFFYVRGLLVRIGRPPLPPGPRPILVIGNVLDMPKVRMWEGLRDLSAEYGDLVRLRMFNKETVILGSPEVIFEVFDRRSANTSGRKQTPSIPLMGHDTTFGLMPYGQQWKSHRRAFWQQFNPTSVTKYNAILRDMAHSFLITMLGDPAGLEESLQQSMAATLLRTLYGFDVKDRGDGVLSLIWDCIEGTRELLISGGFMMDFFPILRFAPSFLPFHRKLAKWRTANLRFKKEPFARYKAESKNRDRGAYPCVVGEVIANLSGDSKDGETLANAEGIAKGLTLDTVNAGTDTTTSIVLTVFFAMSLYPSIQQKAQAELDAVVGPDRLPDFSDRESLVYLDAIIKEAMRWMPSAPVGLTHCTMEDDIINGYFIPAGTVLLANIWACLHDSAVYDDPETFRPERFLRDGKPNPHAQDPGAFFFGFGRRICPGRHFGLAAVFIYVASALHVFDFSPPLDEHGREIKIEPRMASGFVSSTPEIVRRIVPSRVTSHASIDFGLVPFLFPSFPFTLWLQYEKRKLWSFWNRGWVYMNQCDFHLFGLHARASLLYALGLSLALLGFLYLRSIAAWRARSRGLLIPPGPKPLPFLGNALDMPKAKQWEGFRDLCAKYGNILCLRVFSQPIVVLGSADVIVEYLDKRSANTSDRKQTASLHLMGYETSFGLMSYGPEWKLRRRAFWQHFNPTAVGNYQPVQRSTARTFLRTLLKHSQDVEEDIAESVATTLLRVLYGIEERSEIIEALPAIQGALEGSRRVLVSGGFIVDFFPILQYSPSFVPFQKQFSTWRTAMERLMNTPFALYQARATRLGDDTPPCVVSGVIASLLKGDQDNSKQHVADVELIANRIAVDSVEAGTDTTVSTLETVFLAMSLYPEIQKKAQAELDTVVGPNRLPDFSDRDSLVYTDAIIKEALRWMPPTPLGLTHCTRKDDELRGYFIPAGTVLIANIWACLHDPKAYKDPDEFRPERFLREGKSNPDVRDPADFVFGFGRRTCPGRHFGLASIFINVASVLHTFNISRPLDDSGREIIIRPRMTNGFVSHPEDSRCLLRPRSPETEGLILRSSEDALA